MYAMLRSFAPHSRTLTCPWNVEEPGTVYPGWKIPLQDPNDSLRYLNDAKSKGRKRKNTFQCLYFHSQYLL